MLFVNTPNSISPVGVAEFKYPYTPQSQTPEEAPEKAAASKQPNLRSSLTTSGELKAKTNHKIYYIIMKRMHAPSLYVTRDVH